MRNNTNIANFTIVWGCPPKAGVLATTQFAVDLLKLFERNFDIKTGSVRIPAVFNKIISSDAAFETATCNLS